MTTKKRTVKRFTIVSNAQTFEELVHTAMLVAYEINHKYQFDLTSILLVPNKQLVRTQVYYTQVDYAADNKGTFGLPGVDPTIFKSGKWLVRSTEKTLTDKELSIASLWFENQSKFPSTNLLSSLCFDKDLLVEYIAKELEIETTEVKLPQIEYKIYDTKDIKK
ncbi:hypothetical protein, partial [Xanthovirga aplysinae]|uniref:DUF4875 domain-containing protein n=1 Tax=Xanthovirga aplysinae TaxID=2529853 RepID=UPI0012BB57C2